jgi:hypothetical protein
MAKTVAAAALILLATFLLASCGDLTGGGFKAFDYELRGRWVSNDASVYSGVLEIDYDRITITGCAESQSLPLGNDDSRPFNGFTKGVALKGYSQDGKLFIEDSSLVREGIPYTYTDGTVKLLKLTFGARPETLQYE